MKKFIIIICALILLLFIGNYAYYHMGFYIDLHPGRLVTTFVTTDTERIYMERDGETVPFEVRGVSLGSGIPGEWGTDYAIDEETYLRWFAQIQKLGANTIRVYTILQDDFYNAFYAYNAAREEAGEEPLWLIHGVWVNDYTPVSPSGRLRRRLPGELYQGLPDAGGCPSRTAEHLAGLWPRVRAATGRMSPDGSSAISSGSNGKL